MTVQVLSFASLQAVLGPEREVELPDGANVAELLACLEASVPALKTYGRRYRVAVNQELAGEQDALPANAEVALLPPVSGGSGDLVRLTESEISVDECLRAVRREDCGAVVTFLGTVRQPVDRLEYSAYEPMARKELDKLAVEVHERFPEIKGLAMWHRFGSLKPGEVSVCVAVSSPHRGPAFAAARWAIDTLKATVPLWKKELGPDGEVWIEGDARVPG